MNLKVMPYSLALAGDKKLSSNFAVKESACHDGTDTVFVADELVDLLQKFRDHYGKPVCINSGHRTEVWNKAHGGAAQSQHKYGRAADINIDGVTPAALAAYVESMMPSTGGIGIYKSFTHVDVRANRARWNGERNHENTRPSGELTSGGARLCSMKVFMKTINIALNR